MKCIEFNESNLSLNDIDKVLYKVRALIINDSGETIVNYYAGLYMLLGGKVETGETEIETLKREIREEAGIDLEDEQIMPFLQINSYDQNYFDREAGVINRLTKTTVFIVKSNKMIDESKRCPSESEKQKKSIVVPFPVNYIKFIVESNMSTNSKRPQFDREILTIIDEYMAFLDTQDKSSDMKLSYKKSGVDSEI